MPVNDERLRKAMSDTHAAPNTDSKLLELLEDRHEAILEWQEPWPACGPDGNDVEAYITIRASVNDCINLRRKSVKAAGGSTMGNDLSHLADFISNNWARVVERDKWCKKLSQTRKYLREANRGAERNAIALQLATARLTEKTEELTDKMIMIQELRQAINQAWTIFDDIDDERADEWQNKYLQYTRYAVRTVRS